MKFKKNIFYKYFRRILRRENNLLYLVILSFVFISTSALSLSGGIMEIPSDFTATKNQKNYPPIPVLIENLTYPVLSAQGVLAVDLTSGISLYEKKSDLPLLPASTTKIITALVALDTFQLDQHLTVPIGVKVDGQKMGLYPGEVMRFEDLLYGLLVYSANDAAMTLAHNHPEGYGAFIDAMNIKAQELSMKHSRFANPVGLDDDGQRSTARDLVRASEVAMKIPEFAKIVGTKQIAIKDITGKTSHNLKNINELLEEVPGVLGVKTGWTENARENLVTYIERDNHKIMIAILGSQDRFGETKELITWIFAGYKWEDVSVISRNTSGQQLGNMR